MWDCESKRIAICGDGHGRLIRAVMWDTGSDLGEFTGHSRSVNSVDFRPCRPYRLVSSSDDMTVAFYQGPHLSSITLIPITRTSFMLFGTYLFTL